MPLRTALTPPAALTLRTAAAALVLVPLAGAAAPATAAEQRTIAEIQGTGATTPLSGQTVTTRGVVTAAYPSGGFRGLFVQTPGSGGREDSAASHGLFVYMGSAAASTYPGRGAYVEVTGRVGEFGGQTQITPAAGGVSVLDEEVAAPRPVTRVWPGSDAERETLEGMLLAPKGSWTVSDTYTLNRYAEIGLARGRDPLPQPTDVARPGPDAAAVAADNATKRLTLDDGASIDFLPFGGGAGGVDNRDIPLPYLTPRTPIRVGAPVRFTRPVVLDYRFSTWRVQPTEQLTAANDAAVRPAVVENTRTPRPDRVGGDLTVASLNVLNLFTETGEDWVADGGTCSFYDDRDGNPVTVNSCNGDGPRGAADRANLERQRAKSVAAISGLDADVLGLEEIENSAKYAGPDRRDDALEALVRALNEQAGWRKWQHVPSPPADRRPAVAEEDVIRTAFIYQRASVRPVGASRILTGSAAFDNAREPLAQRFRPVGGTRRAPFLVVVNHFKSKSSGVDDGTGQGNANPDRVAQAEALVDFTADIRRRTGTDRVLLVGDFNAYTQEDPMQVLYDAGYADLGSALTGEPTYLFGGLVGSLDHVLASPRMRRDVTGADVWNINAGESPAFEYSRFNYNATDFYAPTPYRSSDHDPLLVGIRNTR